MTPSRTTRRTLSTLAAASLVAAGGLATAASASAAPATTSNTAPATTSTTTTTTTTTGNTTGDTAAEGDRDPVVIIGGLFGSGPLASLTYVPLESDLKANGFTTSNFTTPDFGLGPMPDNAARLGRHIDKVLAETGAEQVDIVAHSQGGLISRYYIQNLGGTSTVDSLTMLGTPNNGTTAASLANTFLLGCLGFTGCNQQAIGTPFLAALNAPDQSPGDVEFFPVVSKTDGVVNPYTSTFMRESDGNIQNVLTQDQCPDKVINHFNIILDGGIYDGIVSALDTKRFQMTC